MKSEKAAKVAARHLLEMSSILSYISSVTRDRKGSLDSILYDENKKAVREALQVAIQQALETSVKSGNHLAEAKDWMRRLTHELGHYKIVVLTYISASHLGLFTHTQESDQEAKKVKVITLARIPHCAPTEESLQMEVFRSTPGVTSEYIDLSHPNTTVVGVVKVITERFPDLFPPHTPRRKSKKKS
jgi:hypothetical protein